MKPKVGIIIQARMASTRLPNKIMKPLAGKPVLWHVVERCKRSMADQVIVATSINRENNVIEEFCKKYNCPCFRGSEEDVLERYYESAKKYGVDIIIRITGDCPLISPEVINNLIKKFQGEEVDYLGNLAQRSFPRGLDCEIFSFKALEKAHKLAKEKPHREHVTAFIYSHPEMFKISSIIAEDKLNRPNYRLCIDTKKDYFLLSKIYDKFYKGNLIKMEDVIKFLDKNPKLAKINIQSELQHLERDKKQGIKQKFV
jgi:spore coat polysaccharide biosynthesis protein SpsF